MSGKSRRYKPEYCEEIIRYGKEGKNLSEIGRCFGITVSGVIFWAKQYPEFGKAKDRAMEELNIYKKEHRKKKFSRTPEGKSRACKYQICRDLNSGKRINSGTAEIQESHKFSTSKYDPEYCIELIKNGLKGRNIVQFADDKNLMPSTLYDWAMKYPEFKEAMEMAKVKAESYWWNKACAQLDYKFSFKLWQFIMINQFGYKKESSNEEVKKEEVQNVIILPEVKSQEEMEEERTAAGNKYECEDGNREAEADMDTAEYTEEGTDI